MAHHARLRRNRGPWLEGLLADQARVSSNSDLEDLTDFAVTATATEHALIVVDKPAPSRAYAIVLPDAGTVGHALARVHVLDGQPREVHRALFSQILVQARRLRTNSGLGDTTGIIVDGTALSPSVEAAVREDGGDFAVVLDVPADSVAEAVSALASGEPVVIDGTRPDDPEPVDPTPVGVTPDAPEGTAERGEDAEGNELADPVETEEDETADDTPEANTLETEPEEKPAGTFECFDCDKSFSTPQGLGAHSRTHQ